jgi:hypothetical protein
MKRAPVREALAKRDELRRAAEARDAAEAAAGAQKVSQEHRDVVKRYKGQQK